jgi:tRNA dimethylallyltransferase
MPAKVLAIVGPTASGKTRLGVELALMHGGEIVSVDSMQVYRGMDIGTAKPGPDERRGVLHHMMDIVDPWEDYSVARFVADASRCVDGILARGALPILVGGTGLYLDSLLSGRVFAPRPADRALREALRARMEAEGRDKLYGELMAVDPETAKRLHPGDEKRIIRALEIWQETGKTVSEYNRESTLAPPKYEALIIGLDFRDRADLRARIAKRVDDMMQAGLVREVEALLEKGVPDTCTAMQAIGYKEIARALRFGESLEAAAGEIKLRSQQYAKRQRTWFKRNPAVRWIFWEKTPDFVSACQRSTDYVEEAGLR